VQKPNKLNNLRLQGAVAGAFGGAVGWVVVELLVAPRMDYVTNLGEVFALDALFGAITGLCIGLALGAAEGILIGARHRLARGAAIGAGAGLFGGMLGLMLGEAVYQPLQGLAFVGRMLGWSAFGAALGLAEGITRRSRRGMRSAALGGAVGGAIGGFMFDLVGVLIGLVSSGDTLSRGIALIILGACIGLFIVVMEKALADGWLKVLSGRFEGRDFFLDKPRLAVGCDERCDVPLFGDPQVLPQHAVLTQISGGYAIEPVGGSAILVSGAPLQGRRPLQHEDVVTIGATRLLYRLRKGAATVAPPVSPTPPPLPPAPRPARTCPFCGAPVSSQARFCNRCGSALGDR